LEEAIISYDRALEIQPTDFRAWNNRGGILVNLGQYQAALESYDRVLQLKPDDEIAARNRAVAAKKLAAKQAINTLQS
jgi:tetratricopeptide (TPR) repeat protein